MGKLDAAVLESEEYKSAVETAAAAAVETKLSDAVASAVEQATSPLQESIEALEANNGNLLTEKKELSAQFSDFQSKFEGIDVEAMQSKLAEIQDTEKRDMIARGEHDKVFELESAKLVADHNARITQEEAKTEAALAERLETEQLARALENTLIVTVRDGGISQAFVTTEADKSQLRSVHAIAKDTVMFKDEVVPVVSVDKNGQSVFRHSTKGELLQNGDGNFGYQDWLVHLSENEGLPLYSKPNSHSNPNAISTINPKGFVKSKMSAAEKASFKSDHGIQAYNALPFD